MPSLLQIHFNFPAELMGPALTAAALPQSFREFSVFFHDELKTFYTRNFEELGRLGQLAGVRDGFGINYGANKVRFPHPVPVGSRIRSNAVITSVEETKAGVNVVVTNTVEIEGVEKPALVSENIRLLVY